MRQTAIVTISAALVLLAVSVGEADVLEVDCNGGTYTTIQAAVDAAASGAAILANDNHIHGPFLDHRHDRPRFLGTQDITGDVSVTNRVANLLQGQPIDVQRFDQRQ